MKSAIAIGLFVFSNSILAAALPISQTEACKKISPAIVAIETGRPSYGTGFIVSADGWIVTAAHVVVDESTHVPDGAISVILANGSTQSARIRSTPDGFHDFALLKIEATNLDSLDLDDASATMGENLAVVGFPFSAAGRVKFCLSAMVSATNLFKTPSGNVYVIYFQGPSVKGLSGSPVMSLATGKVIGILTTKLTGISKGLDEQRKRIQEGSSHGAVTIMGVNTNVVLGDVIDTLDNQLANGLGTATGAGDAALALKKEQQKDRTSQSRKR